MTVGAQLETNATVVEKKSQNCTNYEQTLNAEELHQVEELRELVKDDLSPYYDTNFNLLRWIQGNPGMSTVDVSKRLRKHLRMRKSSWDLDSLSERSRSHPIHKHWKFGITGNSEVLENVIVNVEQLGQTDYTGMVETYSMQDVLKARTKDLEDMLAACMKIESQTGKQASVLYVMDMEGLKFDKQLFSLVRGPLRALSEFMSDHYVEVIKYFIMVNAPSYIAAIWTIAKPILPERTRQKVHILSSSNWREAILDYASPNVLPSKWNLDGSAELFKAVVEPPLSYPVDKYFRNLSFDASKKEKIRVTAGKSMIITKELKAKDVFDWWILADSDFGMGVFYSKNKEETNIDQMNVIVPCLEWMPGPSEAPLTDKFVAKQDGFYKIWLSNEAAWWKSLNVLAEFVILSEMRKRVLITLSTAFVLASISSNCQAYTLYRSNDNGFEIVEKRHTLRKTSTDWSSPPPSAVMTSSKHQGVVVMSRTPNLAAPKSRLLGVTDFEPEDNHLNKLPKLDPTESSKVTANKNTPDEPEAVDKPTMTDDVLVNALKDILKGFKKKMRHSYPQMFLKTNPGKKSDIEFRRRKPIAVNIQVADDNLPRKVIFLPNRINEFSK
ncbi:CRAL/TRIO domain-containing protein [Ditylenchus destructor]|nr:CRAL/TRIO domain-containing protein [Ditylenchus destructor]